jgi:DNA polymerase eta
MATLLGDDPRHQEGDRVIGLMDMDCFYVQVEQRENPHTWGKPCAVVQYTGGGVIAVNYEARAFGVKRGFRIKQCKEVCPDIHLFRVPETKGKGDLSKYREASNQVFQVIVNFDPNIVVERASIDESYLDMTAVCLDEESRKKYRDVDISDVAVAGTKQSIDLESYRGLDNLHHSSSDDPLITGAKIIKQLRQEIRNKTEFTCSAGVSFNKFLSKIACTVRKPNGQSILSRSCVPVVFRELSIYKVRNLGGKLGQELMHQFNIETMHDLSNIPLEALKIFFGDKTADMVYQMGKGNCNEVVSSRSINKSIGCGKNFAGIKTVTEVKKWIENLADELLNRLELDFQTNDRTAKGLVVNIKFPCDSFSKTLPLRIYDRQIVSQDVMKVMVSKLPKGSDGDSLQMNIISMSLVAHKFIENDKNAALNKTPGIQSFFSKPQEPPTPESIEKPSDTEEEEIALSTTESATVSTTTVTMPSPDRKPCLATDVICDLPSPPTIKTPNFTVDDQKGFFYRKTKELLEAKIIQ